MTTTIDTPVGHLIRAGELVPSSSPAQRMIVCNAMFGSQSAPRIGRFSLVRILGSGGMGTVYEAFDPTLKARVALKVFHDRGRVTARLLKREFRSLLEISHENLLTYHEAFIEHGLAYISMELICGQDIVRSIGRDIEAARLAPNERWHENLRATLRQLATGVSVLHASGLVHQDIKPSNVLVTHSGRVVVLDFGLLARCGHRSEVTGMGRGVGTPAYMAPEQHECGEITAAADCYSIGVTLYQAICGRLPSDGVAPDQLAAHKATSWPQPPSHFAPALPRDLDELIHALLNPSPSERPSCADILCALSSRTSPARRSAPPFANIMKHIQFVGRELELEQLHTALERSVSSCTIVAISGAAGIGKTQLVSHFLDGLGPQHVVLRAKCYERESLPYKALDGVIDSLVKHLARLPTHVQASVWPRRTADLMSMFPELSCLASATEAASKLPRVPDAQESRAGAVAALRELLARLAERSRLVMWIDDLDWADSDSLACMRELLATDAPRCLCIGTFRAPAARLAAVAARALRRRSWLSVEVRFLAPGPLEPTHSIELAARLLGTSRADLTDVAQRIARESGGNPALIRQLSEIVREHDSFSNAAPIHIEHLLNARIRDLSADALCVLRCIALAGGRLKKSVASALVCSSEGAMAALHELNVAKLVRSVRWRGQSHLELYHDRFAASTLHSVSESETRALHSRIADVLLTEDRSDPEQVAWHLRQAGRSEEERVQLLNAIEGSVRVLAYDRVVRLCERALDLGGDPEQLQYIRVLLASSCRQAGRAAQAAQLYLLAARSAADEQSSIQLLGHAAHEFLLAGQLEQGDRILEELTAKARLSIPRGRAQILLALLEMRLRTLREVRAERARPVRPVDPAELLRIDLYWLLGEALVIRDPLQGSAVMARCVRHAHRAGEPTRIARALAFQALTLSYKGASTRSAVFALLARAAQVSATANSTLAQGTILLSRATSSLFMGLPTRALHETHMVERHLREAQVGAAYELSLCQHVALCSITLLCRWQELGRPARIALAEAEQRDLRYQAAGLRVHTHYACLVADEPERAEAELDWVRRNWPHGDFQLPHLTLLYGAARGLLYQGRAVEAVQHLDACWPGFASSMLTSVLLLQVEALLTRARACAYAYAQTLAPHYRARALADARRLMGIDFTGAHAGALVVRASIALSDGHRRNALEGLHAASLHYDAENLTSLAALVRMHAASLAPETSRAPAVSAETCGVANVRAFARIFVAHPGLTE